jgi:hypothetical protein
MALVVAVRATDEGVPVKAGVESIGALTLKKNQGRPVLTK